MDAFSFSVGNVTMRVTHFSNAFRFPTVLLETVKSESVGNFASANGKPNTSWNKRHALIMVARVADKLLN